MRLFIVFFILSIFCVSEMIAQENSQVENGLSGNLQYDSREIAKLQPAAKRVEILPEVRTRKSPALAGLMSLVIPGAGELYTGHYYEAAAFFVVEAAAISVAVIYNNKGDKQTTAFQNVADQQWSAVKYAKWMVNKIGGDSSNVSWIENNMTLPPWKRVDWNILHKYEDSLNFSHHLEQYGLQQYYELIGKYPQYSPGWNDYNGGPTDDFHNVSQAFLNYAIMRGKANDYYNYSAKAVIAIYINHVLSAVNAVWGAVTENKSIMLESSMEKQSIQGISYYAPTLKMRMYF